MQSTSLIIFDLEFDIIGFWTKKRETFEICELNPLVGPFFAIFWHFAEIFVCKISDKTLKNSHKI